MAQKPAVTKGKWYIWINDTSGNYILNGVYLMSADKKGGWDEAKRKFHLSDIIMDGRRAPSDKDILLDQLTWKVAEVKKTGQPSEIPSCLTYSQLMDLMIKEKIVHAKPPSFPTLEADPETDQDSQQPDLQTQSLEDNSQTLEHMGEGSQNIEIDHSHYNVYQEEAASPDRPPRTPSRSLLEEDLGPPPSDYDQLLIKYNKQSDDFRDLQADFRSMTDKNLRLEELLATGQMSSVDAINTSTKGMLQFYNGQMSESTEATVKREVTTGFRCVVDQHILPGFRSLKQDVVAGVQSVRGDLLDLTTLTQDLNNGVRTLLAETPNTQDGINSIIQKTSILVATTNKINEAVSINTIRGEDRDSTRSSSSKSRHDSGYSDTARDTKRPKKMCTFCHEEGHYWEKCPDRPQDHFCNRCLKENHLSNDCWFKDSKCPECGSDGHSAALHQVSDPDHRVQIIHDFGLAPFKAFLGQTPPSKSTPSPTSVHSGHTPTIRSKTVQQPAAQGHTPSNHQTPGRRQTQKPLTPSPRIWLSDPVLNKPKK